MTGDLAFAFKFYFCEHLAVLSVIYSEFLESTVTQRFLLKATFVSVFFCLISFMFRSVCYILSKGYRARDVDHGSCVV